ncbi:hypothetical protein SGRIM128S_00337 [Streptomyces griseomycini]
MTVPEENRPKTRDTDDTIEQREENETRDRGATGRTMREARRGRGAPLRLRRRLTPPAPARARPRSGDVPGGGDPDLPPVDP